MESAYAEDDGPAVEKWRAAERREHDRVMVEGMERSPRRGLIRIVVAAGPSIVVESAAAAAENTDQNIRMPPAGQSNPRRYTGFRRTASGRRTWEREGERMGGEAGEEKDGQIEGVE